MVGTAVTRPWLLSPSSGVRLSVRRLWPWPCASVRTAVHSWDHPAVRTIADRCRSQLAFPPASYVSSSLARCAFTELLLPGCLGMFATPHPGLSQKGVVLELRKAESHRVWRSHSGKDREGCLPLLPAYLLWGGSAVCLGRDGWGRGRPCGLLRSALTGPIKNKTLWEDRPPRAPHTPPLLGENLAPQ